MNDRPAPSPTPSPAAAPAIDADAAADGAASATAPRRVQLRFDPARLAWLQDALAHWQPAPAIDGGGWAHGTDPAFLQALVTHWREHYRWQRLEDELNRFAHHEAVIDGQRIHFLHEPGTRRADGSAPTPLILTHGWPGSVVEFLGVIDALAHPERHGGDAAEAFDVVVPCLPGYGWSGPPVQADGRIGPIAPRRIAGLWHRLMTEVLAYRTPYVAQGGDWGSSVSSWLAFDHPSVAGGPGCAALHLNMVSLMPAAEDMADLGDDEQRWMAASRSSQRESMGYLQIQSTRPQSLGPGLDDSPIALAAWIVEKFQAWSDCGDDPLRSFTMDRLIDNLMVYWLTRSAGTSTWLYRAAANTAARRLPPGRRIEVPTGFAGYPADIARPPPRAWVQRLCNLQQYRVMPRGGHFAAFEVPALWLEDLRAFVRECLPRSDGATGAGLPSA